MNREDIPQGPSFRPWCVRAIQAGSKSQTRRAIPTVGEADVWLEPIGDDLYCYIRDEGKDEDDEIPVSYQPGEIYYVREALVACDVPEYGSEMFAHYAVDGKSVLLEPPPSAKYEPEQKMYMEWRKRNGEQYQVDKLPARYMRKEAARYFIRIEDVWVEAYGEISAEDARSEGVTHHPDWRMQGWHGREAAFFNEIVLPGIHDPVPDWLLAYEFEVFTRDEVEAL